MSGVAAHSDAIVFIATSSCWLVCSNFAFVERNPDSSAESSWYRCRCCSPEGFEAAWERDPPRSLRGVARCGMPIGGRGREREQEGFGGGAGWDALSPSVPEEARQGSSCKVGERFRDLLDVKSSREKC